MQLILDKDPNVNQWKKGKPVQSKWCRNNCISTWKRINSDPPLLYFTQYTNKKNHRPKLNLNLKFLEESIGQKSLQTWIRQRFLREEKKRWIF